MAFHTAWKGSVFGELPASLYSAQMRESADKKNSQYGHFSRSDSLVWSEF